MKISLCARSPLSRHAVRLGSLPALRSMPRTIRWSAARRCSTDKNIIDNAVNSADHTTLVAAVKAAGLVETLKGPGPFTVLAPTNDAFEALPAGTVDNLLKPENKDMLAKILTCHVIAAKALSTDITKMVDGRWRRRMSSTPSAAAS